MVCVGVFVIGRCCLLFIMMTVKCGSTIHTEGIIAFPFQQWNEGVTLLRYKYEGWNFNSGNYLFTTDTK